MYDLKRIFPGKECVGLYFALLSCFYAQRPDGQAYINKYTKLLSDPTVNNQTIIVDNIIVGTVAKFVMEGDVEITYLDRKFWGQGIAKKALNIFLDIETTSPIFGRVAFDRQKIKI